jgi:N-acetylmuramoyl-L-alanine amidase
MYIFLTLILVSGCAQMKGGYSAQSSPIKSTENTPGYTLPSTQKTRWIRRDPAPAPKSKAVKGVIILDPGHGGEDYGTHSSGTPKYHEKYLNLSTAKLVQTYLQTFGYTVQMTRTDDTFIALDKRAAFANERAPKLFISIHYNSAPSPEADGIEVFYFRTDEDKTRVNRSKQLAQSILDKVVKNTAARSRGVKHGNYAVIRETKMPAVLIEGGFLTNYAEMEKIKDSAYLKQLSLGIAQGIDSFLAKEQLTR